MDNAGKTTICIVASEGKSLTNFRGAFIKYLVSKGNRVVCVSVEPEDEMSEAVKNLGAEYLCVEGDRLDIGITSGFKMIGRYKKLLKSVKPDMTLFYMSKPIAFGSIAAILTKTKHFSIMINGLENAYYRTSLKDRIVRIVMSACYKIASRKADVVIFHNHDDMNYLKTHWVLSKDNALVVGGSGVDMKHFAKKPLPEKPVFLMVARLLWSKGIREFLAATEKLKKECPDAEIMLVGGLDENDEALTKQELDKYIEKSNIEYCGYTDDVRPYLERCSVFVLPSYHEGLPRSVCEALSVGRAVITTDVPGCRETVVDGKNGFIVPVRESEGLAEKMILLAKDRNLREKMAEESYKMCCEKFDSDIVNRAMYESMITAYKK